MQRKSLVRHWAWGRTRKLNWFVIALVLLCDLGFVSPFAPSRTAHAQVPITFPETGFAVSDPFLSYWQERGGLFSYGYPISDALNEDGLLVQYFERARFELHSENAGTPYEVLLSPLGLQLSEGRDFPIALPGSESEGTFFADTGHTLQDKFLAYWKTYGGLARFGFPISEELNEISSEGRQYEVQYFERARLELHPENDAPYDILLGQIGKQMLTLRKHASMFVTVHGDRIIQGRDLSEIKIKGFNYFPRDYAWTEFEKWPADRVAVELDAARSLGANTLRVFVQADAFGGSAAGWSQQDGFARFVEMATARDLKLIVGLFDGYRKWPTAGWDDWPTFGSSEDAQNKAYVSAVVGRWKDEPSILAWDLYNEPDFVGDKEFRWEEHRLNRLGWLARMATEVRRNDRNHLLTIGVALAESNFLHGPGGATVADLVDFISVHYYTRNYPGKNLYDVLKESRQKTCKPIVIEEIGQATLPGGVDMSADDTTQANFLRAAIEDVKASNVSGLLVWT
ncbi:MAG: cellulase family glycosylhydrolase, partial [Chloroflexia bacterium]